MNIQFSKEVKIANIYLKCSSSLAIRDTQSEWLFIKKINTDKDVVKEGPYYITVGQKCQQAQLWESVWEFLKKFKKKNPTI